MKVGQVIMELFAYVTPKIAEKFGTLYSGEKGYRSSMKCLLYKEYGFIKSHLDSCEKGLLMRTLILSILDLVYS